MAPIATAGIEQTVREILQQIKKLTVGETTTEATIDAPTRKYLKPTGILDQFEHIGLTPVICREFPTAQLVDWINAPNADELLTDHISHINGVTQEESDSLLQRFNKLVSVNHDLQVRFRWQNKNDIAIRDNRSNFHAATFDYEGLGDRSGNRVVGISERPFFDPNSVSRREALAGEKIGAPLQVGSTKKR